MASRRVSATFDRSVYYRSKNGATISRDYHTRGTPEVAWVVWWRSPTKGHSRAGFSKSRSNAENEIARVLSELKRFGKATDITSQIVGVSVLTT